MSSSGFRVFAGHEKKAGAPKGASASPTLGLGPDYFRFAFFLADLRAGRFFAPAAFFVDFRRAFFLAAATGVPPSAEGATWFGK
jgi:hypothetical protein